MESNHIQLNVETINNLIEDINKVSAKLGAMCFYCNKVINDDEKDIIHTMKHIEGDYQPVIFHKVCYDTQGIKRCKVCDTLMRGKKFIGMKYCSLDCKHTMLKKIDGERKAFLENVCL
jgi:hypothetical protein